MLQTAQKYFFSNLAEFKRIIRLFFPIYVANIMSVGMGLVDTLVAGNAGIDELAGVALGTAVCTPIFISLSRILIAIVPMISRHRGKQQQKRIGHILNNAKLLSILLSLLTLLILYCGSLIFNCITSSTATASVAKQYVYYMMLGIPAAMLMRTLLCCFEGFENTRPAMAVALCGLLLNYPLNLLFVFGWGIIPPLGGAGCGLATAVINILTALSLLRILYKTPPYPRIAIQMLSWRRPSKSQFRSILNIGFPLGIASFCESSFFRVVTLIISPLGILAIGAQQLSINISIILYMLPFSFGITGSVRSSYFIGKKDKYGFSKFVSLLIISTITSVLILIVCVYLFRIRILSLFTSSNEIIYTTEPLIILCILYQLPDSLQALMSGLLRGCHDTAIITWTNLLCYWCIGLPFSYILARTDWIAAPMGPVGAWIAFIFSAVCAAILLSLRFVKISNQLFSKL